MEWNHSRYQPPRGHSTFLHQSLRPRCWYYDNEDEDTHHVWQRDASPQPNRYTNNNELASPPPIPSLKIESSGTNGNNGNGGMLLQSFSSLGMPQLEDSTEIQSFFLPQNPAFTVNQALSPNLPPLPPQLQQQPEQQYGAHLPVQLSSQFSEFTEEPASYYPPAMPIPAMPTPQAATRSSVDYFPEGIPTLHSMHGSVPTLPPSFGSLEQAQQQQQQQQPVALEDQDDSVVQDTGHTMFHPPLLMTPTDEDNSLQTTLTLPTVNFPARPSSSISDDTPPDYSPVIAPIGRAKRGFANSSATACSVSVNVENMFDTSSSGSRPLRHDAETFRVAEELIMLSSRAASASSMDRKPNDSPSNISGFFEHTAKTEKRVPKVKAKKGRSQSHHPSIPLVKQAKTNASSSRGAAHKSSDRDGVKQELDPVASAEIINSRCDLSHSELLKEHRVRFRRVRRRWNIEQRNKKQEYLARFHVQGIPLVQHLEALTHWR
ncbi:hypothetical protein PC122_g13201 [Phytophthora cactorum]|nr:hypothetical protein PC122_g13201 [Phytophthora cactorum]